jgi:SAM-dependent methyltransferase
VVSDSKYFDTEWSATEVAAGRHRELVGGAWDELGKLQLDFLRSEGLRPDHKLLDIGCGCLRGGIHFVRFLDAGNYFGVDISEALLDAGFQVELGSAGLQDRLRRENLYCTGEFEFWRFGRIFDFAIAQSLFTHLSFNRIRQCLERLAPVMLPGGAFYATFFELPDGSLSSEPLRHSPGDHVTHGAADPYHYRVADLVFAARNLPWSTRYIGDWEHPRGQRMLAFVRRADEQGESDMEAPRERDLPPSEAARLGAGPNHYGAHVGRV